MTESIAEAVDRATRLLEVLEYAPQDPELPPHLTTTSENSTARCLGCGCRITIGGDGTEYGHYRKNTGWQSRTAVYDLDDDCPYRPEGIDPRTDLAGGVA